MISTTPRPYRDYKHLGATIDAPEGGAIFVQPLRADNIHFDIARSNHLPANLPDGEHGSHVLNIGRGVEIRASGNAKLVGTYQGDDQWAVDGSLYGNQYPSGRELTATQDARARALIGELITRWASTHAGDIAQADDIDRNNAARGLEEQIAKHATALVILREQLNACEEGESFTQYPDLPTKGR